MFPANSSWVSTRTPCRSEIRPTCCIRCLHGREGRTRKIVFCSQHIVAQGSYPSCDLVPQLLCYSKIRYASACVSRESGTHQILTRTRHTLLSANNRAVQKPWKWGRTNACEFTPLPCSSLLQNWHADAARCKER